MDCCENKTQEKNEMKANKEILNHSNGIQMKGGLVIKMNTKITLWVVIGVLFVATLFLTFQAGAVGSVETIQATASAGTSAASSYGGMVGGC